MSYHPTELGSVLYEDYEDTFDRYCFGNRFYADGTFHLLFGQLPNIKTTKIRWGDNAYYDARVHLCYLSPSGTGKGVGANVVAQFAEWLDLAYQPADKITDSALLGTVDNKTKDIEYGWLHPDTHGIDILAMTEASMILNERPTRHAQEIMNILQEAMNPMHSSDSTVTKKIGYGKKVEVSPTLSLFMTTYPPKHISDIILDRGLLQRMFFVVSTERLDRRERIAARRIKTLERIADQDGDGKNGKEQDIVDKLRYINRQYRNTSSLSVSKGGVEHLKYRKNQMLDQLDGLEPFIREEMAKFATRMDTLRLKMAMHFACLRTAEEIEAQDIGAASIRCSWLFEHILSWLETTMDPPQERKRMDRRKRNRVEKCYKICVSKPKYDKTEGWVLEDDLRKGLQAKYNLSHAGAQKHIDYHLDHGLLDTMEHEGRCLVRPT